MEEAKKRSSKGDQALLPHPAPMISLERRDVFFFPRSSVQMVDQTKELLTHWRSKGSMHSLGPILYDVRSS
jgi:hypothetical protein